MVIIDDHVDPFPEKEYDDEEPIFIELKEGKYIGKCKYLDDIPRNFTEVEDKKEIDEYRKLFYDIDIKMRIIYKTSSTPIQYLIETINSEFYHLTLDV